MAAKRPAKISTTKKVVYVKECPACAAKGKKSNMSLMKMVRHSRPSGMFWVCPTCAAEVPTHS
ncbi:MAG: hypothetical protein IIY06_12615 [Proteobacteria bacterium]|jgi:hypothetical protein|nr:hypothetical protein [Pseudomonadota bacterium]